MRLAVQWSAAVILIVGMSYCGVRLYKLTGYRKWLATVSAGDDTATVRKKMGSPDWVRRRPEYLWCRAPGCESEFMYGHSMPPEWWVVGFDSNGRVIWTGELQSP